MGLINFLKLGNIQDSTNRVFCSIPYGDWVKVLTGMLSKNTTFPFSFTLREWIDIIEILKMFELPFHYWKNLTMQSPYALLALHLHLSISENLSCEHNYLLGLKPDMYWFSS